ncbi:transposase [Candidatus Phycorickettsia trachydisci]|uniref:Transposase n=1 Tax=Candidatus Phycorickettsia trachydisci TaxID=2115978 RepID=A0A2P1P9Q8_9RICK|nr:transposase [Candidatus Phycorickettsia trachydisci]
MYSSVLGIDVSKATFDVALLINDKIKPKKFNNNPRGFLELTRWLQNKEVSSLHACMEATGGYENKLAEYLYDNKIKVSVVNPARVKGFALSRLSRVKTDQADCELIAYFCQARMHYLLLFQVLERKPEQK